MEVALTGNFVIFPRDYITKLLEDGGVKISPSISKKTSILFVGENGKELKTQEAQLCGIPIVTEIFLADLIRNGHGLTSDKLHTLSLRQTLNKENREPSSVHAKRKLDFSTPFALQSGTSVSSQKSKRKYSSSSSSSKKPRLENSSEEISSSFSDDSNNNIKFANESSSLLVSSSGRHPPVRRSLLKKVIALEGQIGVGKSTLSQKMLRQYQELCGVYEEQTNEGFLKLFYGNTAKYGFAFQWGMLKTRIYQLKLAQHDQLTSTNPPNKFFVWDRSMIGDYIFALWNHLLGSISIEEMQVYESEFGGSITTLEQISFLSNIHLFVFLNDEPSACKFRVEEHRKHESEQGIPLAYYTGIDDVHFSILISLLHKRAAKAIVLNWGEYENPQKVLDSVSNVIESQRLVSTIDYVARKPVHPSSEQLLYHNAAQIQSAYENIKAGKMKTLDQYKSVFLPRNTMLVDPRSKDVVEEHRKRYDIQFYENAYKRVVMWHISQYHKIFFYDFGSSY